MIQVTDSVLLPFFHSVFSVSCAFTYWSIFMLVSVTLFYVPLCYHCLFIFVWLSVILLSGFALFRPLLVSEAIFTHKKDMHQYFLHSSPYSYVADNRK